MRFKSQEKVVTREDIKRFASEFDPQPYHLDEAAAEQTPLKGLAASGWHTAANAMRLAETPWKVRFSFRISRSGRKEHAPGKGKLRQIEKRHGGAERRVQGCL